jgi:hypothetical protein
MESRGFALPSYIRPPSLITPASSVEKPQLLGIAVVAHVALQGVLVDPSRHTDLRGAKLTVTYQLP